MKAVFHIGVLLFGCFFIQEGHSQDSKSAGSSPIGGFGLLNTFVKYNAKIPLNDSDRVVEVKGLVNADGSASALEVVKGTGELFDHEALRIMGLFRAWQPIPEGASLSERAFTYSVHFPALRNSDYRKSAGGYEFYYDKQLAKTPDSSRALFKVFVPSNVYGVPQEGDMLIAKRQGKEWRLFTKGSVNYVPVLKNLEDAEKKPKHYIVILSGNLSGIKLPAFEVYPNGVLKTYDTGELVIHWTENGLVKSVKEKEERLVGKFYEWYDNGILKWEKQLDNPSVFYSVERLISAYDSLGNSVLTNGFGYFKNIDPEWGEGAIEHGYKNGIWKGFDEKGNLLFEEEYKKGVFQKGVGYYGGEAHAYSDLGLNPEFTGGLEAFDSFIKKNLKYPKSALRRGVTGRTLISFVIRENGEVSNVQRLSNLGFGLEEAAIKVVESTSGHWTPGVFRGRRVNVRHTLPLVFSRD